MRTDTVLARRSEPFIKSKQNAPKEPTEGARKDDCRGWAKPLERLRPSMRA